MHHLVADDASESMQVTIRRYHYAALHELKKPAYIVWNKPGREISLLEVQVRRVKNEWNAMIQGEIKLVL